MSTLRERLAIALAKKRGGSQTALAKACGVSQPSVHDWFSGETKTLRSESLLKAAKYLDVRIEWLQYGNGPMRHEEGTVPEVREPAPAWPSWPFRKIPPERWQMLSSEAKSQIEGFALGLLMAQQESPPPRKDGTNG